MQQKVGKTSRKGVREVTERSCAEGKEEDGQGTERGEGGCKWKRRNRTNKQLMEDNGEKNQKRRRRRVGEK